MRKARIPPQAERIRVCIRVFDWSEWSRQVVRGVQHFAHDRPRWQLGVDAAPVGAGRLFQSTVEWDGVITSVLRNVVSWRRFMKTHTPHVVGVSSSVPDGLRDIASVRVDDDKVAEAIGAHLLSGGFRRLALYGGHVPGVTNYRALSLIRYAANVGVPLEIFETHKPDGSRAHARKLLNWVKRLQRPIGIVTWNMDIARQIVEACNAAGIVSPDEAAVVGWDDDPLIAETIEPSISGAVLPAEKLGYEAARLLDHLMSGGAPPREARLVAPSGAIHIRQSSDVLMLPDREVYLARQHIRERACEGLSVAALARAVGMSRRKLELDFQRVLGAAPHEMILRERVERARLLLVETDWDLEQVADRCGMGTADTLRRVISARLHVTPGEYRRRFASLL